MARNSRKRSVSFRNYALHHIKLCCFSKVEPKKLDLVEKHGSCSYKGLDFATPWHYGVIPPCDEAKWGRDLEQLDHIWFITSEWKKIEFHVIQWLNQCNSMVDIVKLLPDSITNKFDTPITGELTLSDEWIDMVQNSDEFNMLETLVFTNEILEQ